MTPVGPEVTGAAPARQRPRTCVACREEAPKRALIRIVRSPDGNVALDERGKLPGRGAYLCASPECVAKARKTGALSRALKTEISAGFYDELARYVATYGERRGEEERNKELRALLGLSRRAGLVQIGVDSVKSQSVRESLLILAAVDCSKAVLEMIAEIVRKGASRQEYRPLPLSVEELSAALGAGKVQAIALPARNGLADKVKILLEGFEQEGGVALE